MAALDRKERKKDPRDEFKRHVEAWPLGRMAVKQPLSGCEVVSVHGPGSRRHTISQPTHSGNTDVFRLAALRLSGKGLCRMRRRTFATRLSGRSTPAASITYDGRRLTCFTERCRQALC